MKREQSDVIVEEMGESLYYGPLDRVYNIDALIDTWEQGETNMI